MTGALWLVEAMKKTIKFYTLGCKVNQYETQAMREQFMRVGYRELENKHPADAYLINTCTVTQRADSESLNYIRRAIRENPRAKIIVAGCLTESDAGKIKAISRKISIIKNKDKKGGISYFQGHTRAFLKIQDGCDNFCSYCKVPLVRGRPRSKNLQQVACEARALVKNGFKEIVLCGICLGAYGRDLKPKKDLVDVVEVLEKIDGLLRIRLSSIEARDVTDKLIKKIAASKNLCPHLHIPIQSGDDGILKKMNRKYSRQDYLRLIKKIKTKVPRIAITTDVLVGFPGESEDNFQNTVNLVKAILPLKTHIFPYSKREDTLAADFQPQISSQVIRQRIAYLKSVAETCALKYRRHFLGKKLEVLVEGRSKDNPEFWEGYTANYLKVKIKSGLNLRNACLNYAVEL